MRVLECRQCNWCVCEDCRSSGGVQAFFGAILNAISDMTCHVPEKCMSEVVIQRGEKCVSESPRVVDQQLVIPLAARRGRPLEDEVGVSQEHRSPKASPRPPRLTSHSLGAVDSDGVGKANSLRPTRADGRPLRLRSPGPGNLEINVGRSTSLHELLQKHPAPVKDANLSARESFFDVPGEPEPEAHSVWRLKTLSPEGSAVPGISTIPKTCESTQTGPEWSYDSTSSTSAGSNETSEAVLDIGSPQIMPADATTYVQEIASVDKKPSSEETLDAEKDASWPLNFVNEVVNAMSQSEAPASPVTRRASLTPNHLRLDLPEVESPQTFDEVNVQEAQLLLAKMLEPVSLRPAGSRTDRRRSAPPRTLAVSPLPHQQVLGNVTGRATSCNPGSPRGSALSPLNGCMPHFPAAPPHRSKRAGFSRPPKQNPLLRHASPTSNETPQCAVQHS